MIEKVFLYVFPYKYFFFYMTHYESEIEQEDKENFLLFLLFYIFIIKETCQISLWNMDINNENNWRRPKILLLLLLLPTNITMFHSWFNKYTHILFSNTYIKERNKLTNKQTNKHYNIFILSTQKVFETNYGFCGTVDSKTWQSLINKVCFSCFYSICCCCCKCFYYKTCKCFYKYL